MQTFLYLSLALSEKSGSRMVIIIQKISMIGTLYGRDVGERQNFVTVSPVSGHLATMDYCIAYSKYSLCIILIRFP